MSGCLVFGAPPKALGGSAALRGPALAVRHRNSPLRNSRGAAAAAWGRAPSQRRAALLQAAHASTAAAVSRAEPANSKIGFLGLGIMGYPMALNLIKAGYDVTVWNRTMEKCDDLAAGGAAVCQTPAEVVDKCDITLAMLADPAACLAVALGENGVVSALRPGKGYVDVSTVDGATSRAVAAAIAPTGAAFLEAPVSGSKGPAEQGQLIFLAAGDKGLFDAALPLLEVMGKASFHLGDVGAGAHMKLVVNMVMGSMMGAFAEGLALAQAAGLSQQDMLDVVALGAISSPMLSLKGPAMVEGRYPTAFPLKHQQKDMRLALALGDELAQQLPVAAASNELYKQARAGGHADADFSAVLEAVAQQQRQRAQQ